MLEELLQKKFLHEEFEKRELKAYLLTAIRDIKKAYDFNEEKYRLSVTMALYQDILNKINELEVTEI